VSLRAKEVADEAAMAAAEAAFDASSSSEEEVHFSHRKQRKRTPTRKERSQTRHELELVLLAMESASQDHERGPRTARPAAGRAQAGDHQGY